MPRPTNRPKAPVTDFPPVEIHLLTSFSHTLFFLLTFNVFPFSLIILPFLSSLLFSSLLLPSLYSLLNLHSFLLPLRPGPFRTSSRPALSTSWCSPIPRFLARWSCSSESLTSPFLPFSSKFFIYTQNGLKPPSWKSPSAAKFSLNWTGHLPLQPDRTPR